MVQQNPAVTLLESLCIAFEDIEELYIRGLFRLKVLIASYEMIQHEPLRDFLSAYTIELDEIARFKL